MLPFQDMPLKPIVTRLCYKKQNFKLESHQIYPQINFGGYFNAIYKGNAPDRLTRSPGAYIYAFYV